MKQIKRRINTLIAACLLGLMSTAAIGAPTCAVNAGSTGLGRLFFPNPVATLQDFTLRDQNDADYPALQPAYRIMPLTNLNGTGTLMGAYAKVISSTGPLACSPNNQFIYNRSDDRFEQVMAYYWVTETQKYIQSLGFFDINNRPQPIKVNQWGQADAHLHNPSQGILQFGKYGVDTAEDGELIVHEYAHALLDSVIRDKNSDSGYNKVLEFGAIHEGFSDYWAYEVPNIVTGGLPDPACLYDWYMTGNYGIHCLSRIDTHRHYPENIIPGDFYGSSLIWSNALYGIRQALGSSTVTDKIFLTSYYSLYVNITFVPAAQIIVATANTLYGPAVAATVKAVFVDRGILQP